MSASKPAPPESWDKDEWTRKLGEHARLRGAAHRGESREHAIANDQAGTLDQPLLRYLTNAELNRVVEVTREATVPL